MIVTPGMNRGMVLGVTVQRWGNTIVYNFDFFPSLCTFSYNK